MTRPAICLLAVIFLAFSASAFGQASAKKPWEVLEERIMNTPHGERGKIIRQTISLGRKFYDKGDYRSALEYFKVATRYSDNHEIFANAAHSAYKFGDRDVAALYLKKAFGAAVEVKSFNKI